MENVSKIGPVRMSIADQIKLITSNRNSGSVLRINCKKQLKVRILVRGQMPMRIQNLTMDWPMEIRRIYGEMPIISMGGIKIFR